MEREQREQRSNYNRNNSNSSSSGNSAPVRRMTKKRKVCALCAEKLNDIDYKDVARLRKSLSERSKILPRRITGNCAKHQRLLTTAVKRARYIALIPYISD